MREICNIYKADLRWAATALLALQEAAEDYLVHLFEDACVRAGTLRSLRACMHVCV